MKSITSSSRPDDRWEGFHVYGNRDGGTFHILVIDSNRGRVFADQLNDREDAEWTAGVLNAALAAARR
jgi:hypothetical protein